MKKTFLGSTILLALLLSMGTAPGEQLNLDFTLVNATGYDFKEVKIAPSASDDWGDNILKRPLKDGESLEVTFHKKATEDEWDIKVVYTDGEKASWKGAKLTEINKITLYWDKEEGSSAKSE
jgi:hypothetical protein